MPIYENCFREVELLVFSSFSEGVVVAGLLLTEVVWSFFCIILSESTYEADKLCFWLKILRFFYIIWLSSLASVVCKVVG